MSGAGRQIGIGVTLVLCVTLLTFLFSFLGTILAGAMVGMMVGFTKRWHWQFLFVSLIFPAALLTSMNVNKGNLRDSVGLAAVCFGAFWSTYLLTRALSYLEGGAKKPAPKIAAAASLSQTAAAAEPEVRLHSGRVASSSAVAEAACDPGLGELQGIWLREVTAPDGKRCKKVIEVARQELAVSLVDRAGKVRFLAKGDLTVERIGAFKMVKVAHREQSAAGISAEELALPDKWLYRVVEDKLTVAADFEDTAAGREPLLETYVRSRER